MTRPTNHIPPSNPMVRPEATASDAEALQKLATSVTSDASPVTIQLHLGAGT